MSNYNNLKGSINNSIYENQTQQITGTVMNTILNEMTNVLGAGYQFAGVATVGMNPGGPDARVFYLAGEGIYTNFGNLQVPQGHLGILKWDSHWHLETIEGLGGGGANLTGYVSLASTDDLPDEGVATLGYLCGTNLYLYVGTGGDTKEGKYQNCGSFRGPQGIQGDTGVSVQSVVQTTTSTEDEGINIITCTLENGTQSTFQIKNGSKGSQGIQGPQGVQGEPGRLQAQYKQVETLPTASADTMDFIYLVESDTPNVYDMYYTEENQGAYSWKHLGTTAVQLSDYATKAEVSQLEAEVGDVGYREDEPSFTLEAKYVSSDTGNVANSSTSHCSDEIDVAGYERLTYVGNTVTDPSGVTGCAFYDSSHTYISGRRFDVAGEIAEKVYALDIPAGAKYFRFSIRNAFKDDAKVVLYAGESVAEQLSALQTETTALDAETKALDLKIEGQVQNYVNGYLYQDQGISPSNDDIVCPFVSCQQGDKILWYNGYSATKSVYIVFYDENKAVAGGNYYLANSVPSRTLTVGAASIKFVRATFSKDNPDVYLAVNNVVKWTRKDGYVGVKTEIGDWYPLTKKADFELVPGYVNGSTGNLNSSSTVNHRSKYIKVYGFEKVMFVGDKLTNSASVTGAAFYDENHQFLSGLLYYSAEWAEEGMKEYEVEIPDGAFYFAFTIKNAEVGFASVRLVKNKTIAESVKGMLKQDGNIVPILGSQELYFSGPTSETAVELSGKTSANLYAEYDSLVAAYPNYMKRDTDLGSVTVDGTSYVIAAYTFGFNKQMLIDHEPSENEVLDSGDNVWESYLNPRKILLVSGMHGEEHTSAWGVMLTVKAILESDEPWAHYLKDNFIFKILPCVNPYGFSINRRYDSEGNVPNRDESIDDAESTYYMNWVDANKDAFILIDCHGTQGRYAYFPVQDFLPLAELSHSLACKLSAAFLENWTEFYNGISAGYGTTYSPFLVAKKTINSWTRGRYAVRMYEDYGVQEIAIETPCDLITPDRYHSDLRNCKLTKDMLINTLQTVCGMKELPQ